MFTLFDVKMIHICTFPAALSTERVLSHAERVAYLRYSINLQLFKWRLPGLVTSHNKHKLNFEEIIVFVFSGGCLPMWVLNVQQRMLLWSKTSA